MNITPHIKRYDAFVCYAYNDEDFMVRHIMTGLEKGEPSYKLCLHERDWMPGRMIVDAIVESVAVSRRIILLLSPHFVRSKWATMELDEAHKLYQKTKYDRVVVVYLPELQESDLKLLPDEIQIYLQSKEHICWGEPDFLAELRKAMPKQPLCNSADKMVAL